MSPKEIVNVIESKEKGIKVVGVFDYKGEYLVTYVKNGNSLMDPFFLVSKDGKNIRGFNPMTDPIAFSDEVSKKPPLYVNSR